MIRFVGSATTRVAQEIGGIVVMTWQVLRALVPPKPSWRRAGAPRPPGIDTRELWKNLYKMGNCSVPIVVLTAFFAGGLMTLQTGPFVKRLGATSIAGGGAGYAVLREIGPILIALMFSGRVGANNTAELATMTVTEQIDGIRALAIDPIKFLVVPRVLAMIVMLVALTVIGDLVALTGASVVGHGMLEIDWATMYHSFADNLRPHDFLHGIYRGVLVRRCDRGRELLLRRDRQRRRGRRGPRGQRRGRRVGRVDHAARLLHHVPVHMIGNLGQAILDSGRAARELWLVYVSTLAGILRGHRPRGEIARQMFSIGNRSLIFIIVTLGFIGMVMTYEACLQLSHVTGDFSQLGMQFIRLVVSDFGPTLTAMMLATRVGAGIAAEIGSMKVTEQVDALRMSGVLPIDYLVVPRFIASIVMTLALSVIGGTVMYLAGGLTAKFSFGVNPALFFDLELLRLRHVGMFVVKAVAYGAAIPVVAGFCGLRARGSSEGVGWATTAAVIGSSFAVIVLDFVISAAALYVFGGDL